MNDLSDAVDHLVVSTHATFKRCLSGEREGRLLRVWRHVYVDADFFAGLSAPYEVHERATLVRACAVQVILGPSAVISHQTAALCHGVEVREELMDIHVCGASSRGLGGGLLPRLSLPDFSSGIGLVPEVRVLRHSSLIGEDWQFRSLSGLVLVDPATAGAQCAHSLSPRDGVVVASGVLRGYSRFDRFIENVEASREREEDARARLAARAQSLVERRGKPRAMAVIRAADAACESVRERELLWILKAAGFWDVRTQVHHRAGVSDYYVDFELPGLHLIVEYDGEGKRGETVRAVPRSYDEELVRQKDLEAQGCLVLRAKDREVRSPDLIVREIVQRSGLRHPPRPVRLLQE